MNARTETLQNATLNFVPLFRHAIGNSSLLTGIDQACETATVHFFRVIVVILVAALQLLASFTHTPTALATLVEIMSSAASPPNARVAAAIALLDRGYGRPSTAVFVEMTSQVSSADREALLRNAVAAMDEMAASTKAAEKRAIAAEQRVLELEKVGGRQH